MHGGSLAHFGDLLVREEPFQTGPVLTAGLLQVCPVSVEAAFIPQIKVLHHHLVACPQVNKTSPFHHCLPNDTCTATSQCHTVLQGNVPA